MSNKKLVMLGIIAALMMVWAVMQARVGKGPAPTPPASSYLIQGLDPAKIASIVVGKGEYAARLVREGNHFVVANKDNYPAATGKINNLITSCLDIQTVDFITSNPENHESLDVTEEKAQNIIKFFDGGGQIITGIVIGSSRLPELDMSRRSTYARLIASDDVYTAKNVPLSAGSAMDYIDKEIVNVGRPEVARVTVTGPEGSYTLRADANDQDNIVLEGIPEGKKLKDSDCRQVLSALSYLSFDDVKKQSSQEEDLNFDRTYVCELKDSTVYTFNIAGRDGKTYVKCVADYADKTPVVKEKRVESEEELKSKEAKLLARDRAVEFTQKHQVWLYEIPEWKAKNLTRKLADLVEQEKVDESSSAGSGEESET